MPRIKDSKKLPYSVEKVFDVALDIKHYPKILPYIQAVKISSNNESQITASLTLGLSFIRFTYLCEITYKQNEVISVTSKETLFKKFSSKCVFERTKNNQTIIKYELDALFANPVFEFLAGVIMPYQTKVTLRAFENYLSKV